MNFVKNYFIIGHQLFVMINHVFVIHNQEQFYYLILKLIHHMMIDVYVVNVHVVVKNIKMKNQFVFVHNVHVNV